MFSISAIKKIKRKHLKLQYYIFQFVVVVSGYCLIMDDNRYLALDIGQTHQFFDAAVGGIIFLLSIDDDRKKKTS